MMIVADGGGTKTHWLPIVGGVPQALLTSKGFNPFAHSPAEMEAVLRQSAGLQTIKDRVSEVWFFGAGCTGAERCGVVCNALRRFFPKAGKVWVGSDLLGAARASCGNDAGICCILGTGANACHFDGERMEQKTPALGYILGDEGGGAYFGKHLLRDFFYGLMPAHTHREFVQTYRLEKDFVLQQLYAQPETAKPFLASFFRFAAERRAEPYIKELLLGGLNRFFDWQLCVYDRHKGLPVHFVGSVAFALEGELRQIAEERGMAVGKIIKEPIYALADWVAANHIKQK